MSQEERSIFWKVTVSVILSKKVYMYMCSIPNSFRDRAISLYSTLIRGFRYFLIRYTYYGYSELQYESNINVTYTAKVLNSSVIKCR
jgi:hypothetical protein